MRSAASTARRMTLSTASRSAIDAGLDAARTLVADADDLDVVRAAGQDLAFLARRQPADHADDLRRADIQHRNDMRPLRRKRLQARQAKWEEPNKLIYSAPPSSNPWCAASSAALTAFAPVTASGVSWMVVRSASRRSTAAISRSSSSCSAFQLRQHRQRRVDIVFRQLDDDAVVHVQIPATAGDADKGLHARA